MKNDSIKAFAELEHSVSAALQTYSNVHRGSGHKSLVSSHLYEQARRIILDYLCLNKKKYVVIFCSPERSAALKNLIAPGSFKELTSREIGLPVGIRALAVRKSAIPKGVPFQAGGGTTRLVSPNWIVWAGMPDRLEAGTPAIINTITFTRALQLVKTYGKDAFRGAGIEKLSANDILYHDEFEMLKGHELLGQLRKTMIGKELVVPVTNGQIPFINLDNAASTPAFKPVFKAFILALRQSSTIHRDICEEVRSICSKMVGAPQSEYDVIFTSNATESLNLAAQNLVAKPEWDFENVVVNTILEHNSNDLPWRIVPNTSLIRLGINSDGFVDLIELDNLLADYNSRELYGKKRIRIVAISGASNVLGVFNDLAEISRISHKYGAHLLVDAAQMVAHRKVDMDKSGIDYLAFSAHKGYAPFGTGVLISRKGLLNFSQERLKLIESSGEENTAGIAAMGKALVLLQRAGMDSVMEEEKRLTIKLLQGLKTIPALTIHGIKDPDSPLFALRGGVISFSFKSIFSNTVAEELAIHGGIGIRYGCHCAHILIKHLVGVGPALERFQHMMAILLPVRFPGVARVSLGIGNCEEDIDRLIFILLKIAHNHKWPRTDIRKKISDLKLAAAEKVFSLPQ